MVGGNGGLQEAGAGVVRVTRIITRLSPWGRTGTIRSRRRVNPSMPDRYRSVSADLGGAFH
jgi:hypothetical protein